MKAKGGTSRAGDVIPYVFCLAEGEEPAKSAQADRAKHPDEVRRAGSELKIGSPNSALSIIYCVAHVAPADFEYYLAHQVLPPIERLCEPIEGTDRARLAECFGTTCSLYIPHPLTGYQVWILRSIGVPLVVPMSEHFRPWTRKCRTRSVSRTANHSLSVVATARANSLSRPSMIEKYDTLLAK